MDRPTDMIAMLERLVQRRRTLVLLPLLATAIAALAVFLMPPWYTATSRILPPQQSQSIASSLIGQLGALAGTPTQLLGIKNPNDIFLSMLKSRTIADRLIERFDLRTVYEETLLQDTRDRLERYTHISSGRDGVISIEVEDQNRQRAADIANAYIEELRKLASQLAVSEAGQRRLFFEGQLQKAKSDLVDAEVRFKQFVEKSGVLNPQDQVRLTIATAAGLRAQIAAREIQLAGMKSFATEDNPEVKRLQREISGLRSEMAKMDKDTSIDSGDTLVRLGKAPEVNVEYVRRFRDVKYAEVMFELLAKQYELARLDEGKEATVIQVLDVAQPPEKRSSPKRVLITLAVFFASTFLTILYLLCHDAWSHQLSRLRTALR